jgi:hypothetical protein
MSATGLSTTVMVMIESWMFDSLAAEVSYRAEQMKHAERVAGRRRRGRKPVARPVEVPPVDAADSRTKEKVSAG